MHITGRVDSVSELTNKSGTSQKGSVYSFWQQIATIALGGQMVEIIFRADKEPSGLLCDLQLDQVVRVKVENPRIFNGRVSFDASK